MRSKNSPSMKLILTLSCTVFFVLLAAIPAGAYYRTIITDGDPSDWVGIPPVVNDEDEAWVTEQNADIKTCYIANDNVKVYFRMDVYGSISPASSTTYAIFLDTGKPGGYSIQGIEADYRIKLFSLLGCSLCTWDSGTNDWSTECIELIEGTEFGYSDDVWEVGIFLSDISSSPPPETLGVVFVTGTYPTWPQNDYAPNEGFLFYSMTEAPVGGIITSTNLSSFLPLTMLATFGIAIILVMGISRIRERR